MGQRRDRRSFLANVSAGFVALGGCARLGGRNDQDTTSTTTGGSTESRTPSTTETETEASTETGTSNGTESSAHSETGGERTRNRDIVPGTHLVEEAFFTRSYPDGNIDTPAIWHGTNWNWVLTTAKDSDRLIVNDATDGSHVKTIGQGGSERGALNRPNSVLVIDDYAVVVERDNARVQVFTLPKGKPIGTFGERQLLKPYGSNFYRSERGYEVFVTDDYDRTTRASLDRRVHHYRLTVSDTGLNAQHIKAFGETSGDGVLNKVETIGVDAYHDRVLLADEDDKVVKVYTTDGSYTGTSFGEREINGDPEGIDLYECAGGTGYWILTNQGSEDNEFHVYDRETFRHLTAFKIADTTNTDGICLTQRSFGSFPAGAFYAIDDDRRIAAASWRSIADETGVTIGCAVQ